MSEAAPAPAPEGGAPAPEGGGVAPQGGVPFHQTLEHGLSQHTGLAKFKDVNQLASSYIELQTKLGQRGDVSIPQELTPENVRPILNKLGLPEQYDSKAYGIGDNATPQQRALAEWAFQAGVTPNQLSEVMGKLNAHQQGRAKARQMQQGIDTQNAANLLRQEWGPNFDANLKAAEFAATRMGIADELSRAGLNRNAKVMNALANMGNMLAEDSTVGIRGGRQAFGGAPSADMLDAQANKLTADAWSPGVDANKRTQMLNEAMNIRQQSVRARGLT